MKLRIGTRVKYTPKVDAIGGVECEGTITYLGIFGSVEILWDDEVFHQTWAWPDPQIEVLS